MKYTKKQTTTTEQCAKLLLKANSVAIFAHTRPDGDTIGASMALCLALRKLGKTAQVFCDTALTPSFYQFEGVKDCVANQFFGKYDIYTAVDCGDLLRTGEFASLYNTFANTITIDHHCGEYYSQYNCTYKFSSTCGIVYKVICSLGVEIDCQIATFLYMGLCTDTGNFAHSNTDEDSFLLAAKLTKFGADTQKVNRVFFKDTTLPRTRLLGDVLGRIRTYSDGKIVLLYILQQDLDKYGLDESASEGIVQYAINIDTAVIGVSICQHADNVYKVSMRGKDFDVRAICQEFGGGGHINASGCMISGLFEDVVERIVRTAERYL